MEANEEAILTYMGSLPHKDKMDSSLPLWLLMDDCPRISATRLMPPSNGTTLEEKRS